MRKPPWDLRLLLWLFPADEDGEVVVGDLLEIHEKLEGSGPSYSTARLGIRFQALVSLVSLWCRRCVAIVWQPRFSARRLTVDLLVAARLFRRRPALCGAVVGSISLGVGATAIALAFVEGVLSAPFPYPESDQLVRVSLRSDQGQNIDDLSFPEIQAMAALVALDLTSPVARVRLVVPSPEGADRMRGEAIGENYFRLLEPSFVVGRSPDPESYAVGGPREIVLSEAVWQSRFGGRADILNQTVRSNAATYQIVGVVQQAFFGTSPEDVIDFWVPLDVWVDSERTDRARWLENPETKWLRAVARIRGDVPDRGGVSVGALTPRATGRTGAVEVRAHPLTEDWRAAARPGVRLLLAASICLLLLACVNIVALMGARLLERRTELAVRTALGASRGDMVRGLVAEALVLSGVGSALGVFLAVVATEPAASLLLEDLTHVSLPGGLSPKFGPLAAATLGAVSLVLGFVVGIVPVGIVGKGVFTPSLGRTRGVGRSLPTGLLNGVEVALATVLLLGTGLMVRSYQALSEADLGYRTEGLLKMQITAGGDRYDSSEGRWALNQDVLDGIRSAPSVQAAALLAPSAPPFSPWTVELEWRGEGNERLQVDYHLASGGLFDLLEIDLLTGRSLDEAAAASDAVAVVSESLSQRIGGPQRALGRTFRILGPRGDSTSIEVVGVVEDVLYAGAAQSQATSMDLYLPLRSDPSTFFSILVHTRGDAGQEVISDLRSRLGAVDPTAAVHWIEPFAQGLDVARAGLGRRTTVLGALAAVALAMAGLGLYGMMSYNGRQKVGEFAVRVALGASSARLKRLVMAQALVSVLGGLGAGIALAALLSGVVRGFLYGVRPLDPQTVLAVAGVLILVGMAAALGPARLLSRQDVGASLNSGMSQ